MTTENTYDAKGPVTGGCCGGGNGAAASVAELERRLQVLLARVQEARARQVQTAGPAEKKGCCCG